MQNFIFLYNAPAPSYVPGPAIFPFTIKILLNK